MFHGYAHAQKLVFSNSKHSYQRAAQKTLMNLNDFGDRRIKSRIDAALVDNLNRIREIKERIGQLEEQNAALAMTNDRVRSEALDSITKAREVEAMEYEVQHLAQKREADNSYITKLVADNEWMA